MSGRKSGRRKKAADLDEEDLELREEVEDEDNDEEDEEEEAPKRKKAPAKRAKATPAPRRTARGKEAAEPPAKQPPKKKTPAPKRGKAAAEDDDDEDDEPVMLARPPPPAAATGKKEDAPRLFLQSFLGAPAKRNAEAGELVQRLNAMCGVAKQLAAYVEEANEKLEQAGLSMVIKRVTDEREGVAHLVLANTTADYVSQQVGMPLSRPEREYLERILEAIAEDSGGRCSVSDALTDPQLKGKPKKASDTEATLSKLVSLGLLEYVGPGPDEAVLGVRSLAELSGHLAGKAPGGLPDCHLCKMPAFYRTTCSACPLAMHVHCENAWQRGNSAAAKSCPGCKAFWKPRDRQARSRKKKVVREEAADGEGEDGEAVKREPERDKQDEEEQEEEEEEPALARRESSFVDILN